MKDKDIENLWLQINADIDQNEDLDLDIYLKTKGVTTSINSLGENAQNLIQTVLYPKDLTDYQFNNKYKIIKQIDSGGQSDIYMAQRIDGVYEETVVIKLFSNRINQISMINLFLQEMQLLANLKHPGVVTIIDGNISKKDGKESKPWLVLDYIDGPHLNTYCIDNKLNTEEKLKLIINICDTLDFIHLRNVFHKDIKPQNILVKTINKVPYPVLIDFGIAQDADQDQTELIFATQGYSSPEQIKNSNVDHKSDLYSMGILITEILIGKYFDLELFLNDKIKYIKSNVFDKDIQDIILHCIHNKPDRRYQSAVELRSDLNNFLLGNPISFNSHKLSNVLIKSFKKNTALYMVSILTVFLGLGFLFKYTHDIKELQQQTLLEKNATNGLMSFMLNDLYENLVRIGKVDLLQSVVDKSLSHLGKISTKTLDNDSIIQTVRAYINAGRVLDQLEQSEKADNAFRNGEKYLKLLDKDKNPIQYFEHDALLKVYHAQVLSSEGQEQRTIDVLKKSITSMESLLNLRPDSDQEIYWEAHLQLAYHYLEYANHQDAKKYIDKSIAISENQLRHSKTDPKWLYHYSHSYQLLAWYELDFGQLSTGIGALKLAIESGITAVEKDSEDLRKHNNIRILYNQIGFFYLEKNDLNLAKSSIEEAISRGINLGLIAPLNQEFKRELSYSYSTATEIYLNLGQTQQAKSSVKKSLEFSKDAHTEDQGNFSLANDYAIDLILEAKLNVSNINDLESHQNILTAFKIMQKVFNSEPNNNYYKHTILIILLYMNKVEEARTIFDDLHKLDLIDSQLKQILNDKNLNDWL